MGCSSSENVGVKEFCDIEQSLLLHNIIITSFSDSCNKYFGRETEIEQENYTNFLNDIGITEQYLIKANSRHLFMEYVIQSTDQISTSYDLSKLVAIGMLYCSGTNDSKAKSLLSILQNIPDQFSFLYNVIAHSLELSCYEVPKYAYY